MSNMFSFYGTLLLLLLSLLLSFVDVLGSWVLRVDIEQTNNLFGYDWTTNEIAF